MRGSNRELVSILKMPSRDDTLLLSEALQLIYEDATRLDPDANIWVLVSVCRGGENVLVKPK